MKSNVLLSAIVSVAALGAGGAAPAAETVTYKCPGNVYSNTMNAKEAKDKNCTVLANQPVTVIEGPRPRPVPPMAGGSSGQRVDPVDQRARDSDARRILEGELKREEDRLAEMRTEFNNGQPERQGNEKNYQKYIDRVADMKAAIGRKESDIAALKRELAKVPQ